MRIDQQSKIFGHAIWFVVVVFLISCLAQAADLPRVEIHEVKLPNGVRAFLIKNRDAPVVNVQVWYHVGSKDEPPGRTGLAHLLEHLMFQGTSRVGPGQFSDRIIRAGGMDNAYTTEDATVYWNTVPASHVAVALWLEADRMRNLQISQRAFEKEREVVKEERRQRFDNQPYGNIIELLYREAFQVHPYRYLTIGTMEDISRLTLRDAREFYETYYVPNNATVVVVGDFRRNEVESWIREYFGMLEAGRRERQPISAEPMQTAPRFIRLDQDVPLPAFVAAYHMPADGTPDSYPLRLAGKILADGDSSRIHRRLVYERQIALEINSTGNFTEHPNLFFVLAMMNQGHTPAEGRREIEAELERLKTELVPAAELNKAKRQIRRDFVLNRLSCQSRGEELGYAAVVLKDPELVNTELARFLAVSSEDIRRVAREYFVPQNATVLEVKTTPRTASRGR